MNGHRFTKTFDSLEDAIVWRNNPLSDNHEPVTHLWTLKDAYDCAHKTVWYGKASAITNVYNGKAALQYFGNDTLVNSIKLSDIEAYVNHLFSRGDKGSTVNRKLTCLHVMMNVALEHEGMTHALPKFPRAKETEARVRFLSPEEEKELYATLISLGYGPQAEACKVLLYTGFRCGELWRLEKRDVDFDQHILTLWQTKNGHPRSVPILKNIQDILYVRSKIGQSSKIFPEGSNAWLRHAWDKARELMGLKDDPQFVPHCLRHTCATRLSQQGIALPVIKEWLGHTTIQTTIRYAHFNRRDLFRAAQLLAETGRGCGGCDKEEG